MLTIKPPINLKCQKPIDTIHKDMEERIRGNYAIMNEGIRREELLHVTTSSPEIYFAEGGTTNILNEINSESRQEFRLDVINNLINRILLLNTDNFNYQDSVYISNVLRKLGITDVNSFMKQIMELKEERQENYHLLQLYEKNEKILTRLFHQEEKAGREKETEEPSIHQEERYYLHEEIYNRLGTEHIYEDMRHFTKENIRNQMQITSSEMSIAEQTSLIQNFKLHNLKNQILQETMPLYYYHANRYEMIDEETEKSSDVAAQVSSAILVNLIDQIYSMQIENLEKNHHQWYVAAGALFETAENTWKRYEAYHREGIQVRNQYDQQMQEIHQEKRAEYEMLMEISNQIDHFSSNESVSNRNDITEYQIRNQIQEMVEQNQLQNDFYAVEDTDMQLQYLYPDVAEEEMEKPLSQLPEEQIRVQLLKYEEKNEEVLRKMMEIQREAPVKTDIRVDKEKARRDALRALEHPEEVLQEYLTAEPVLSKEEEQQKKIEEQFFNLFSDETKAIFRQYLIQKNQNPTTVLQHLLSGEEELTEEEEALKNYLFADAALPEEAKRKAEEQVYQLFENQTENRVNQSLTENYQTSERMLEHRIQEQQGEMPEREEEGFSSFSEMPKEIERIRQAVFQGEALQRDNQNPQTQSQIDGTTENRYHITMNHSQIQEQYDLLAEQIYHGEDKESIRIREVLHLLKEHTIQQVIRQQRNTDFAATPGQADMQHPVMEELPEMPPDVVEKKEHTETVIEHLDKKVLNQQREIEIESTKETIRKQIQDMSYNQEMVREQTEAFRNVSLVHKEEEQVINENVWNLLRERRNEMVNHETLEQRNIMEQHTTETNLQQETNRLITQQLENVEELVQQNVQRHLGRISDQVYGKIEKRLQNERKRRGF